MPINRIDAGEDIYNLAAAYALRRIKERSGLTNPQIGAMVDLTPARVSNHLNGRVVVKLRVLLALMDATRQDPRDVFADIRMEVDRLKRQAQEHVTDALRRIVESLAEHLRPRVTR